MERGQDNFTGGEMRGNVTPEHLIPAGPSEINIPVYEEPRENDVPAQMSTPTAMQNSDSLASTPAGAETSNTRRVRRRKKPKTTEEPQPRGYFLRHHHGYDLRARPFK